MSSIKEFFSEVFKRHTEDDAEEIVVCGAPGTIPDPETLSSACPKPWLYSRVFLFFLLVTVLLFAANVLINRGHFGNVLVIGAFGVPFTVLVLFFELNVFRNISFYTVFKALLIGGGISLIVTAVLPSFLLLGNTSVLDAFAAGIGEEVAKLLVVYWILKRNRAYPYILNGLLIGAAVGAGFAAFETAEYGLRYLLSEEGGWTGHSALFVLALRNLLAPGGHVVWAAISGAALLNAMRREPLSIAVFGRKAFWGAFLLPVALHVLWDLPPVWLLGRGVSRCLGLTMFAWCLAIWFIRRGLDEVDNLNAVPPLPPEEKGKGKTAGIGRRAMALLLDMGLLLFAAFYAVAAVRTYFGIGDWLGWHHAAWTFAIAILPTALLMEAAIFEVFGTTPGQWAFALRICDGSGEPVSSKTFFRRLFRFWWACMGCGIPHLGCVFAVYQAFRVAMRGRTSYDQAMGLDVYEAPIGWGRRIAATAIPVGACLAGMSLYVSTAGQEVPSIRENGQNDPGLEYCQWVAPLCGLPHEIHESEDEVAFLFQVDLEDGRSQLCVVVAETVETEAGPCLFAASEVAPCDDIGEQACRERLEENATRKERIWLEIEGYLVLRTLVPTTSSPSEFRQALEKLAADADAAEAELSSDDRCLSSPGKESKIPCSKRGMSAIRQAFLRQERKTAEHCNE